jgi:hypothetical protein
MRVFLSLLGLCVASEIVFHHQPKNLKILKNAAVSGDVAMDIHRVASGKTPKHILSQNVFEEINPMHPAAKSVILIVPNLNTETKTKMRGQFMAPSIEVSYPSDVAQVIPDSGEDVIVIKTNAQNYDDFVAQITALLSREFGDNYLFSLVADSPVDGEKSIDRQILQTPETDLGATLPRNGQFPIIFAISAFIVLFAVFGLTWISYEMMCMEPGDNIAYKLGAAYSKKNL